MFKTQLIYNNISESDSCISLDEVGCGCTVSPPPPVGDVGTHSDVISQLHGAFLILICQVDAVQLLRKETLCR